jgi:hypothetical protein
MAAILSNSTLLHRHGALYPSSGVGPATFVAKLHEVANSEAGFKANGYLELLRNWTYKLGAEILTPFGRSQQRVFPYHPFT